MADFSHLSENNEGTMVDVGDKADTQRVATVKGKVQLSADCREKLTDESAREIATTARIAGIQAAKKTSELVPYCHPLQITKADVTCYLEEREFLITSVVKTTGKTGVEMEALVGAQIAAATIYDMIKAVNPEATIGPFHVAEKSGGKSGEWVRV